MNNPNNILISYIISLSAISPAMEMWVRFPPTRYSPLHWTTNGQWWWRLGGGLVGVLGPGPRALFMRFGLRLWPAREQGLVAAKIWSTFAVGVKDFSPVVRRPIFNFELHLICMQGENILDEFARSLVGLWMGQNGVLQNGAASDGGSCTAKLSTSWLIGRYRVFGWLGDVVRFGFISFGWHPVEHTILLHSPFDFNPLIEHIVVGVMNQTKF